VRDLMSEGLICAHQDDNVDDVAKKMSEAQVRRLPVIGNDEKLCGIVSLGDLSRETPGETAHEALEGVTQPGGEHRQ
jgi:CBS-domain-containing membrane protein